MPNAFVTWSWDDLDSLAQTSELDQRCYVFGELYVSLQRVVGFSSGFSKRFAKEDGGVAAVAAKLEHGLGFRFADDVDDDFALVVANIHEIFSRSAELIDGCEYGLWIAADGWLACHEGNEFFFASVVELEFR